MPGKAGQIFRQDRVALVRHGRGALLARRKIFLRFAAPRCAAGGALSTASRSTEEAIDGQGRRRYAACRSRGMTWVETGSRLQAQLPSATSASTDGSMLANVPTGAGNGACGDLGARRRRAARLARSNSAWACASLQPERGRLGVDRHGCVRYRSVFLCSRALRAPAPARRAVEIRPASRSARAHAAAH